MLVWMDKHNIAKNVLFSEIGLNVGIYDTISKVRKDILNEKTNSGTHLFNSIEESWSQIVLSGDFKSSSGWDEILTSTKTKNKTTLEVSKAISINFFGKAYNEKLQMIVYEGVVNARSEILSGRVYQ